MAVELAREGKAELLMKGSLHTDELMGAVVRSATGLRTERRISHAFVMDVPSLDRPIIITDAAINIFPTLEDKRHIVQNAIDLVLALGLIEPKVAILSAVETVNPKIPSTVEAAALCKMADRGQITGGILDGPLALDNAIDLAAAEIKKIDSPVAGLADILVVPDLEAGNMLAKSLIFMADADAAGIVLGARVPIILTSRADSVTTRLASCAVAALVAEARRQGREQGGGRHERRDPGAQRGLVQHQVLAVPGASRRPKPQAADQVARPGLLGGQIEGLHTAPRFVAKDAAGDLIDERRWPEGEPLGHDGAVAYLTDFLRAQTRRAPARSRSGIGWCMAVSTTRRRCC